jgi:DNA-binding transcriptional ArsR family regulator
MPKKQINKVIKSIGSLFDVLSHKDRIQIIYLLKDKEMDVNEIHEALEISQSRTSQHLKLLKFNSIVEERKEGKHVFYSIKNKNIAKVMQTALQFQLIAYSAEPETLNLISDLLTTWQV